MSKVNAISFHGESYSFYKCVAVTSAHHSWLLWPILSSRKAQKLKIQGHSTGSMDPWMFWPYFKKCRLPFWLSEHWHSYMHRFKLPTAAPAVTSWTGCDEDVVVRFLWGVRWVNASLQWGRRTSDGCVRVTGPTNAGVLGSVHTCLDERGHELQMNFGRQLKETGSNSPHNIICLCGRIACTTPHERFLVTLLLGWDFDFNSASHLANSRRLQRSVHVSNLCLLHLLNRHITQDAGDKIMDFKLYLVNGW